MSHQPFSKAEAEERVGRKVEALREIGKIPRGTQGKVALSDKTPDGYEVAIEWEVPASAPSLRSQRTWMNRQEYEETIVEISTN